jgi:FAD/FMN-containing dehydrogenase
MSNTPSSGLPYWQNWSGNVRHLPPTDGEQYYFTPRDLDELKAVLAQAEQKGLTVRVSGQRHSQPPLVADDNRSAPTQAPTTYLVDMSCYVDVGDSGIALGPGANQITVNPGVREDSVDAFLTTHDLMFETVTAGGFFSLGGMTAVDVHGGTVDAPIFAETASSFTILGADGNLTTIDADTPSVNGWSPLQFARVSLGGLGIVTRIVLDVLPRPYATTLQGGTQRYLLEDKQAFIDQFTNLLTGPSKHTRMEVFYTPYAAAPNVPWFALPNFLVLWWNVVDNPQTKTPNAATDPQTACVLAHEGEFGAPSLGGIAGYAAKYLRAAQYYSDPYDPLQFPPIPTAGFAALAMNEIESQATTASTAHSELWLAASSQAMFMSYFIELPNLDAAGLGKVWDSLDVVARRTTEIQDGIFHIAAPMEFRFVKAGTAAMAGTYSPNPDAYFVNVDLIGFIEPTTSADYPTPLLQFFADVERDWVAMNGYPYHGKMYGFYDPTQPPGTYTPAFNTNFLADLRNRRRAPLTAYNTYRHSQDPNHRFNNTFLRDLLDSNEVTTAV